MPATLQGVEFHADPNTASWDFTPKVSSRQTIGGKVVQVFGVELGDLTVAGDFGRGGWQEQADFLVWIKELADAQMDQYPNPYPEPYRFFWPEQGWDMLVRVKQYIEPGASGSIDLSNENINPKWQLVLKIEDDNSGLKKLAADIYIQRIAEGLGWEQTEFNGPQDEESVRVQMESAGTTNIRDFVNIAFGIGAPQQGGTNASGTGGPNTPNVTPNASPVPTGEIQSYAATKAQNDYGWGADQFAAINEIVTDESGWSSSAQNPHSTAYGLFQFLDTTWQNYDDIAKTSDWKLQVEAGLNYIQGRYGDPLRALAFRRQNGWY